jgi:hypothetical protein
MKQIEQLKIKAVLSFKLSKIFGPFYKNAKNEGGAMFKMRNLFGNL